MNCTENNKLISLAKSTLEHEANAILELKNRIDSSFSDACELMLGCEGRIVVTGMGKSGHIGGKIASTLASTGSPAFFVHPGEAGHGDMGMITPKDVVLALSNSGETDELITLLPIIKRLGVSLITITGNPSSTLSSAATVNIDVSVEKEACPLNLAPTTSTTVALAMGDAIAIALLEKRGFTKDDFAQSHPSGRLGRRLLLSVDDLMHTGEAIPRVDETASLSAALIEISQKGLGMTAITNQQNKLLGIFTDGDLRRTLDLGHPVKETMVSDVMTTECTTGHTNMLATEALQIMESKRINGLLIVDEDNRLIGALNMHDLLKARIL